MKVKKVTKQEPYGYTRLIEQVVNHNAEVLESALGRIKELEKHLTKEKRAEKLLNFEEFSKSEDMTREEAIDMVKKAFAGWEDEFGTGDDWSREHKARDMAIKALEQEPFKGAYIQVAKERDIAIEQLRELGYSLGEKIRPCEKEQEPIIGEVRAEIEKQEKWLAQAGYNAYNVCVAFCAIKLALRK